MAETVGEHFTPEELGAVFRRQKELAALEKNLAKVDEVLLWIAMSLEDEEVVRHYLDNLSASDRERELSAIERGIKTLEEVATLIRPSGPRSAK